MLPRTGVEWASPSQIDLPPVGDCVRFEPTKPVSHFDRVDALLDSRLTFGTGHDARVRGYVRPLEARPIDAAWLAMAMDWFPPPAFVRIDPPTGGVSVDLTVHLHRPGITLGADEWLLGEFSIIDSTGGLAVEHGSITDQAGLMIAESFHTRLSAQ